MTAPLVSILIPCHDAAPWLAATLESALAQTWPAIEIIVVDDGSRDNSLAIARQFEPRGVRVLTQANRGASAARNAALRAAKGNWFQFLDADDLLAPDKICAQLHHPAATAPGIVFTGAWGRFRHDPSLADFRTSPLSTDLSPREFLLRYSLNDCMMHPAAWLVPRAIAERAGPWDEQLSLNDDGEYFARVALAGERIVYCAAARSYYRSSLEGSLSKQHSRRHLESAMRVARLVGSHLRATEDSSETRAAAAALLLRFAFDYYPAAADLVTAAEREARGLGGAPVEPLGGRLFQAARRMVGWKLARRLQRLAGRHAQLR